MRLGGAALLAVLLFARCVHARPSAQLDPLLYQGWDVSGFEVRGLDGDLKDDLASGLTLAGERKLLWTDHPIFDPQAMQADLERARLFLARRGRPSAEITPLLEPDAGQRSVEVVFEIDPGPVVRLAQVSTEAVPPPLKSRTVEALDVRAGDVFTDRRVEQGAERILQSLQSEGYARARVQTHVEFPDSSRARLRYVVMAGEVYRFGEVTVRGIDPGLHEIARRSIPIEEGERYSPELLAYAEDNLRLLDLFRQIRLLTRETAGRRLDVIADLAQRKPQSITVGAGYWTDDRLRVSASWRHRNLLGRGRGLGVEGSYSRFLQSAGVEVWKPVLFHSRTRGSVGLEGRRESEETYRLLSGEVEVAATYLPSLYVAIRPAVSVAVYDLVAKTDSTGAYPDPGPNLLSASLAWSRNHLNDRLYPTAGTIYQVLTESGFPGFAPDRNYHRFELRAIAYTSLGDGFVFASRLAMGYALPTGRSRELLPNKRFYSGGPHSMRGYRRRELGPRDSQGKPIGGIGKLEASAEVRFPIVWRLVGAFFCDAGQVWDRREEIRPVDLELAVGTGLLIHTPVGPVRTDVGVPITEIPGGEPDVVLHLSVGQMY